MATETYNVELEPVSGGLFLTRETDHRHLLHPLWVRERVTGEVVFDPFNKQRLYEHSEFPADLVIKNAEDESEVSVQTKAIAHDG